MVTLLSQGFRYYSTVRLLIKHCFPFCFTYRVAYFEATRKLYESSWGHLLLFRIVPSAHTLVRWVNENAFASIVQARPCPIFGRPVHLQDGSFDYGPILLLKPFRFHLTMDTLASEATLRPARTYPHFWLWCLSFDHLRDFHPPEQYAGLRPHQAPAPSPTPPLNPHLNRH